MENKKEYIKELNVDHLVRYEKIPKEMEGKFEALFEGVLSELPEKEIEEWGNYLSGECLGDDLFGTKGYKKPEQLAIAALNEIEAYVSYNLSGIEEIIKNGYKPKYSGVLRSIKNKLL